MQSFRFFFSEPFNEEFEFLKNCPYDFHKILRSHSTPRGALACPMASNSYDWDKQTQNWSKNNQFWTFSNFSNTLYGLKKLLWSLSTPLNGFLICAISSNSHDWHSSESEGKRPEPTPLPHVRLWISILSKFRQSFTTQVAFH